jgi:hypothetical protein
MKKKADISLSLVLIVSLVLLLLAVASLGYYLYVLKGATDRGTNIATVQNWVMINYKIQKGFLTPLTGQENQPLSKGEPGRPPVSPLSDPIAITRVEQVTNPALLDSAHKQIADAMYDCWSAFAKGEMDFLGKRKIFCYPCTGITYSDAVKKSGQKIEDFNSYLAVTHPLGGKDTKTYTELLSKDSSSLDLNEVSKMPFSIDTDKDQYIFFVATKGMTWGSVFSVVTTGAASGAVAGAGVGFFFAGVGALPGTLIGTAVGTTVGVTTGLIMKYVNSKDYSPGLIIGPADKINSICNLEPLDTSSQKTTTTKEPAIGTMVKERLR